MESMALHPRTPWSAWGHSRGDKVGDTHLVRLTLSGGPGKGLGRSQRRCPHCRCSWSWGTWSPGQFSLVGGGKEKLLRNKEGGGEAGEQRTETLPPKKPTPTPERQPLPQRPNCCSLPKKIK